MLLADFYMFYRLSWTPRNLKTYIRKPKVYTYSPLIASTYIISRGVTHQHNLSNLNKNTAYPTKNTTWLLATGNGWCTRTLCPFSAVGKHGDESVEVTLHKVKTLSHALQEGFSIGQNFWCIFTITCASGILSFPQFWVGKQPRVVGRVQNWRLTQRWGSSLPPSTWHV